MKSEVPEYWNNYEKEGPRYRTDGTPLHRKCLPGLWMTPEQYKEFLEKKDEPYWCFEDDFENMWTGYCMTADEATAIRSTAIRSSRSSRTLSDSISVPGTVPGTA